MLSWLQSFLPGLLFYGYIKSPNPPINRSPHTNGPKPHQLQTSTPKTQYRTATPLPQTTINEQKREKRIKNNSEKENVVCQLELRFQIHQHALLGRLFFDKKSLNHRLSYPQNLDEALLTTICCSIVTNQFYAEQSTPTKCCLKHITLFATQIEKKDCMPPKNHHQNHHGKIQNRPKLDHHNVPGSNPK